MIRGVVFAVLTAVTAMRIATAEEGQLNRKSEDTFRGYAAGEFRGMPYRWLKPLNYDPKQDYPLVLSLHGRAGVGTDNRKSLRIWNTAVLNRAAWRKKYPCFVVAPQNTFAWVRMRTVKAKIAAVGEEAIRSQLHKNGQRRLKSLLEKPDYSSLDIVFNLLKEFRKNYKIDENRIYVLGGSMGGYGTWAAIQEEPALFAAGIVVCGADCIYLDVGRARDVPIWAFHGTADGTVPYEHGRRGFERLRELGGNCKFTSLKGNAHGIAGIAFRYRGDDTARGYVTEYSSDRCDRESNVWQWLFRQRKDGE